MDRADFCSKRTSPSQNRPDQVEAVERQPSASRYRRTQVDQGHLGLGLAEGEPNYRTKKLLHQLARTGFVEGSLVGDKGIHAVADNLVGEGCTVRAEHKGSVGVNRNPAVVEENGPVGDKEKPVVGAVEFLAVKEVVVARTVRLAAEGKGDPVVGEDPPVANIVNARIQRIRAEGVDAHIRPEAIATVSHH